MDSSSDRCSGVKNDPTPNEGLITEFCDVFWRCTSSQLAHDETGRTKQTFARHTGRRDNKKLVCNRAQQWVLRFG